MLLILFFHLTDRDGATAAGNRILIIFQGMSCFMLGRGMRMLRKTHREREREREIYDEGEMRSCKTTIL